MSDLSPNLALPLLLPAQAQKHVTHNEALSLLDLLVQLRIASFDAVTPPAQPEDGEIHALGPGAMGAWAGQDGMLAAWVGGGWLFVPPRDGWRAWDAEEGGLRVFDGGAWGPLRVPPASAVPELGINTGSDPLNRFAVASPATLFSHEGAGHQLKINKALAGDTASLLFQTGFSGRAEMGTAGNDDWSVKVSADGSSWTEALRIDAATGTATGAAVQSDESDDTSGRLVRLFDRVGVAGWLNDSDLRNTNDLNTIRLSGLYRYSDGTTAAPTTAGVVMHLTRLNGEGIGRRVQVAFSTAEGDMRIRNMRGDGSFGDWLNVITDGSHAWRMGSGGCFQSFEFVIADDAVATFRPEDQVGWLLLTGNGSGTRRFFGWFHAGASQIVGTTIGSSVEKNDGALDGTTGADGKLTIGADDSGLVYIENRTGGAKTVTGFAWS
ncbi:MAG: DUF2793 domain-containing protein [Rhodosalinus sp.]